MNIKAFFAAYWQVIVAIGSAITAVISVAIQVLQGKKLKLEIARLKREQSESTSAIKIATTAEIDKYVRAYKTSAQPRILFSIVLALVAIYFFQTQRVPSIVELESLRQQEMSVPPNCQANKIAAEAAAKQAADLAATHRGAAVGAGTAIGCGALLLFGTVDFGTMATLCLAAGGMAAAVSAPPASAADSARLAYQAARDPRCLTQGGN